MAIKQYKATVYIQVETSDVAEEDGIDIRDYCAAAVKLDLDTEEYGNPCGIAKVEIDWTTIAVASELDNAP